MPLQANRLLSGDDVLRNSYDAGDLSLRATIAGVDTINVDTATIINPAPGGVGQGSKNVAAAATPVLLVAGATPCVRVIVSARPANTKPIAIGGSAAVRATAGAEIGALIRPGESLALDIDDVHDLWIDAQVNGEGVSFTYLTA